MSDYDADYRVEWRGRDTAPYQGQESIISWTGVSPVCIKSASWERTLRVSPGFTGWAGYL